MFSGHSTADQLHVHVIPTHRSFLVSAWKKFNHVVIFLMILC